MNLQLRSKIFRDPKKLAQLLKLAKSRKHSAPKLAAIFNCNKKTVLKTLKENGITVPNLGRFSKMIYCDEDFLETITPSVAYWLGFIAADGCLTKKDWGLTVALQKKDKKHLEKFKKAIKTNAKISFNRENQSVKIGIYSRRLFEALTSLGITPNKSLSLKNVTIPSRVNVHFVRGVFDGDGSLSGKKRTHFQFQIAGNKPFLEEMQKVLMERCKINSVKLYQLTNGQRTSKAFKLQYTGPQVFRILEVLYKDSSEEIRLERKYQKFLMFKEKFDVGSQDSAADAVRAAIEDYRKTLRPASQRGEQAQGKKNR